MIGTPLESASEDVRREAVENACRMANAHSFIAELPEKYDTRVGEGGFLLSGGQKQRVAIARAIVADPAILLLDEATSALDTTVRPHLLEKSDPQSERVVQEALEAASRSRTTVCIAHRLSTIKNADNIVVISHGQVVEQGTHDDLYARGGMYRGLVDAQRISAESKGDGFVVQVEDKENLSHVPTSYPGETPFLQSSTTGQLTTSLKSDNAGVVVQRKYPLRHLFKRVRSWQNRLT
jgi:ATP-binding cassette, subfamily B (MDR/TAP), member 1